MPKILILMPVILIALSSCFSADIDKKTARQEVASIPCNPDASPEAREVMAILARITGGEIRGVIPGQNCYHGNQITEFSDNNYFKSGFERLAGRLFELTGKWPGLIGVDYE